MAPQTGPLAAAPALRTKAFSSFGAGGQAGIDATSTFYGADPDPATGLGHGGIVQDHSDPIVNLPAGEYDIAACPTTTPYFASSVTLQGTGQGKTIIKFTGAHCKGVLFAWGGGLSGFGLHDLTIDMNGATGSNVVADAPASVLVMTDNDHPVLDNVDIIGTKGDHWFHLNVIGASFGRMRRVRIQPKDCSTEWKQNIGMYVSSSALAANVMGSITGDILTVTTWPGPYAITSGQAIVGRGIPAHEYILPFGTKGTSGRGATGTYVISDPVHVPIASASVVTTSSHDWALEDVTFVNTVPNFDAPGITTVRTRVGPWCAGTGMSTSNVGADWTSTDDVIHDGPPGADILAVIDTGIESHGDRARFSGLRVYRTPGACVSFSGADTIVTGGSCEDFNEFGHNDGSAEGSIAGSVLTVTKTIAGNVTRGQLVQAPGLAATPIILNASAANPAICTPAAPCVFQLSAQADRSVSGRIKMTTNDAYAGVFASNGDANASSSVVQDFTVRGSGRSWQRFGFADNPFATGGRVTGFKALGISVAPYSVVGKTTVIDPGADLKARQLVANVTPNVGTQVGVGDLATAQAGTIISARSGGGSHHVLAIGNGHFFIVHDSAVHNAQPATREP